MNLKFYIPVILLASLSLPVWAQTSPASSPNASESQNNVTTVNALFEYPVAPEEISGITEKSNWLMDNFWNNFSIKKVKSVDQAALNHAFAVYSVPMRWADRDKTLASVDKLIASLKGNPTLMLQMTKAAEQNLYGPRASVWIDEVYVRFLEALMNQKKLKDTFKARYDFQLRKLRSTMEGMTAPRFSFTKPDGTPGIYEPTGNYTLIEFGDPSCDDCAMAKLRLDTDIAINDLIKEGKLNICFIVPEMEQGWETALKNYPEKWIVGASENVDDIYDIRLSPTFYLIGPDGKIRNKNIPVERAISLVKELTK